VTDQRLQTSSVAGCADHRIGLKASTINEQHVGAVEPLHFCHDGCDSTFERGDESVVDGWIGTSVPIASVRTLGSAWYSKAVEVPESQPLRYREGEVGKLDWYVIGQKNQKRLARNAEDLSRRKVGGTTHRDCHSGSRPYEVAGNVDA